MYSQWHCSNPSAYIQICKKLNSYYSSIIELNFYFESLCCWVVRNLLVVELVLPEAISNVYMAYRCQSHFMFSHQVRLASEMTLVPIREPLLGNL